MRISYNTSGALKTFLPSIHQTIQEAFVFNHFQADNGTLTIRYPAAIVPMVKLCKV